VNELKTKFSTEDVLYRFDDDGSGTFSASEIMNIFKCSDIPVTREQVHTMMQIIDKNWRNGDLEMDEIAAYNKAGKRTAFRRFV
jgi:Ca2+-binding EF-hand superfamily protein